MPVIRRVLNVQYLVCLRLFLLLTLECIRYFQSLQVDTLEYVESLDRQCWQCLCVSDLHSVQLALVASLSDPL